METTALGKRKRRIKAPSDSEGVLGKASATDQNNADVQEIFRKHFEAQFKPLKKTKPVQEDFPTEEAPKEDGSGSNWSGISSEPEDSVPVVEYTELTSSNDISSKFEAKAFLSPRPPASAVATSNPGSRKDKPNSPEEEDSAQNLKNDLALQRLLSESHLLSANPSNDFAPTGKIRHKALDLRLQALGSKGSMYAQENMPMAMRKGIEKKRKEREDGRRKEAKEAGIVLETEKRKRSLGGRRERGVGAPGVGKFRGGTLRLSKEDVFQIQGRKRGSGPKGRKR